MNDGGIVVKPEDLEIFTPKEMKIVGLLLLLVLAALASLVIPQL